MSLFPINLLPLAAILIWPWALSGQEEPVAQAQNKAPAIKKIGFHTYRVGLVEFNAQTKVISIPTVVNKRESGEIIEYMLVSEKGKVHESILTTKARPFDVQIALKLLKYKAGEGDVFDRLLPAEDRKIKGKKSATKGQAVTVKVNWKDGDKEHSDLINNWALDGATLKDKSDGEAMPRHPWNYTGSVVSGGRFLAEIEGSIIAIYLDPAAIFNTTVPGSEMDERWGANHRVIPAIGTPVTLTIHPAE